MLLVRLKKHIKVNNMAMRNNAGDNKNVNKTYGPIAGSAKPTPKPKPKPKQDITKIPGFQFGRGTE
jgi:hypothetical protein